MSGAPKVLSQSAQPSGTPAQRAAARKDPAVALPPSPPRTDRKLEALSLRVTGRAFLIGPNLTGDCTLELTMEGASTLTLNVEDDTDRLAQILTDEEMLIDGAVTVVLDEIVYVLTEASSDGETVYTLLFEDEVAYRLRGFDRYLARSRADVTRAEFVQLMCDEASRAPFPPMRTFIPELEDKQPIAQAAAATAV